MYREYVTRPLLITNVFLQILKEKFRHKQIQSHPKTFIAMGMPSADSCMLEPLLCYKLITQYIFCVPAAIRPSVVNMQGLSSGVVRQTLSINRITLKVSSYLVTTRKCIHQSHDNQVSHHNSSPFSSGGVQNQVK
jgi:hypothetical protein